MLVPFLEEVTVKIFACSNNIIWEAGENIISRIGMKEQLCHA